MRLVAIAAAAAALLLATAGGYGYHRDELYFLRAGAEPAFGYADQPPLTPLLAHALDVLFGGSLLGLRAPSALMAGLVVLVTGLIARELGASRGAQLLAAGCMAVSALLYAVGHLLSTSTLDLLVWTVVSWLGVRALRTTDAGPAGIPAGRGWWLASGLVAGVGLQNKLQPAFLLAALLVGLLVAGPRAPLRTPWPWAGGLLALLIAAPNLAWQAANGFPQLALSAAIANGSSGSSEPWYLFLPLQLVLISPLLVPVWAVGLGRLARDPRLRPWRCFALAYLLLALLFLLTGGKPYYLGGLYPVLLAAGAPPVLDWARRGALRGGVLAGALAVSGALAGVLMLPLVPVERLAATPIVDVYYDAGETVGWPRLAATVAAVRDGLPSDARVAVLTSNYGEAGAVDHYRPELGPAYSGHNAYWDWGPPPADVDTVIAVGFAEPQLRAWFGEVTPAGRIDNGLGLDNDEQGAPIWVARRPLAAWPDLWPRLRRLG